MHRFAIGLLAVAAGCGGGTGNGNDLAPAADLAQSPDLAPACGTPNVPCTDQSIQQLGLFKPPSNRNITNTADGMGWSSQVNATAGGSPPTESYVYAKFTDTGLMKVAVGDEAAFASTDWDIAFRRFEIRLNSGPSGPSCVQAAPVAGAYDALTTLPAGLAFQPETYMDAMCMVVPDQQGLGTPATLLDGFWKYDMCVQMTGQLFVLQLASGKHVKATVTGYYLNGQDTCNTTGSGGTSGGFVTLRWAFL